MTDEERIKLLWGYFERKLFHSPRMEKALTFFEILEQLKFDNLVEIKNWIYLVFHKYDILEVMHGCSGDCCCSLFSNFIFIVLALSNEPLLENFQNHWESYSEEEKTNITVNFRHFMRDKTQRFKQDNENWLSKINIDVNNFNKFLNK